MLSLMMAPPHHRNNLPSDAIHLANTLPMGNTVLKGRQKLRPRKKRLTSLKKRVLMERLEQWRHRNHKDNNNNNDEKRTTANLPIAERGEGDTDRPHHDHPILCLKGFVDPEELDDDDEYSEILADLTTMAHRVVGGSDGGVASSSSPHDIYIPRNDGVGGGGHVGWAFVRFGRWDDAVAAVDCWNHLVIGGSRLDVGLLVKGSLVEGGGVGNLDLDLDLDWREVVRRTTSMDLVASVTRGLERGSTVVETIGEDDDGGVLSAAVASTAVDAADKMSHVYLYDVLTEDDYEDEECLNETREDIKILAGNYGPVHELRIDCAGDKMEDRNDDDGADSKKYEVCITYSTEYVATLAVQGLNGMTIGGVPIIATLAARHPVLSNGTDGVKDESTLILDNILTEDDFEDEECQEESKADILKFAGKYGKILSIKLLLEGDQKGGVVIQYDGLKTASIAVKELNGMSIGGQPIIARQSDQQNAGGPTANNRAIPLPPGQQIKHESTMILENILTEDDFEDEECREETKADILDLVTKYGPIAGLKMELEGDRKGQVVVQYIGDDSGTRSSTAIEQLNGMLIGGQQIVARRVEQANTTMQPTDNLDATRPSSPSKGADGKGSNPEDNPNEPEPIFSGGKKIPEQYAECKRVPKIPTPSVPREYASKIGDEAIPLLVDMLGELMRLQKRSKDDKNAKLRRRLVMGLREVARGIRARKVKMVVMANNLDMYGAIDSKLQEILDLAREEDVPVFFELNKRKLGKALGKSIKVAVVGIQSSDGAHGPFKELKKLAYG